MGHIISSCITLFRNSKCNQQLRLQDQILYIPNLPIEDPLYTSNEKETLDAFLNSDWTTRWNRKLRVEFQIKIKIMISKYYMKYILYLTLILRSDVKCNWNRTSYETEHRTSYWMINCARAMRWVSRTFWPMRLSIPVMKEYEMDNILYTVVECDRLIYKHV